MSKKSKLGHYLALPELRAFWFFLILALFISIVDFVYLPLFWAGLTLASFLVLGVTIFWSSLKLAQSNEESRTASLRLERIIANLVDGVVAYDNSFKIMVFNAAAEQILGVKQQDVMGQVIGPERASDRGLRLLVQTIFSSLAPAVIRRSLPGVYPQVVDLSFTEPERELRVSTERIVDAKGEILGFVKVIQDRTREVELFKTQSDFITVAAHQLRTPLTGINWVFETLSKKEDLAEEVKEMAKSGLLAAGRLLKTVNDLLDVSKMEEGRFGYNFTEINIIEFIAGGLKNAEVLAKEYGIKLYFDPGPEPAVKIPVDTDKLGMALSNLIDNAIKYNVTGGSVTVKIERLPDKPYLKISVKDTGVGIPTEDMDKLFTKFFRAQNAVGLKTEGTGLGLYIVKNIVNRHGGVIWAESILGRGTIFYFTLPTDPSLIPTKEISLMEGQ